MTSVPCQLCISHHPSEHKLLLHELHFFLSECWGHCGFGRDSDDSAQCIDQLSEDEIFQLVVVGIEEIQDWRTSLALLEVLHSTQFGNLFGLFKFDYS